VAIERRLLLYGGFSNKIELKISRTGFRLVVVDSWLFLEVVINTGLTAGSNDFFSQKTILTFFYRADFMPFGFQNEFNFERFDLHHFCHLSG
jgi:hypothetical protein